MLIICRSVFWRVSKFFSLLFSSHLLINSICLVFSYLAFSVLYRIQETNIDSVRPVGLGEYFTAGLQLRLSTFSEWFWFSRNSFSQIFPIKNPIIQVRILSHSVSSPTSSILWASWSRSLARQSSLRSHRSRCMRTDTTSIWYAHHLLSTRLVLTSLKLFSIVHKNSTYMMIKYWNIKMMILLFPDQHPQLPGEEQHAQSGNEWPIGVLYVQSRKGIQTDTLAIVLWWVR